MFYVAISIVTVYLLYIIIRYKLIPTSISDTYYLGANWLFTAVIWAIAFTTTWGLLDVTSEYYQFLVFLTGVGLLFVGAAPLFKESFVNKVHYSGAITFGVASNLWAIFHCSPFILGTWCLFIPFIKSEQRTFWAEIICVLNIILAYALS